MEAPGLDGLSPLQLACRCNAACMVRLLVEKGAEKSNAEETFEIILQIDFRSILIQFYSILIQLFIFMLVYNLFITCLQLFTTCLKVFGSVS